MSLSLENPPIKPPRYSKRDYVPVHYRVYHTSKQTQEGTLETDSIESRREMYLNGDEKRFLLTFAALAFIALICTAFALIVDKQAIKGTYHRPSQCLLTDARDCRTVYTSDSVSRVVEVSVRVDLLMSIVAFVTGLVLTAFKIFNWQLLLGFLLTAVVKTFFISTVLLVILTNNNFYYNTVYNTLSGHCELENCMKEETANIVMAFCFLFLSALTTSFMTLNVLILGSRILRNYDEAHTALIWAKYDAMTAELFH